MQPGAAGRDEVIRMMRQAVPTLDGAAALDGAEMRIDLGEANRGGD